MQYSLVEQTQRIRIIDITRGVAVLGILTMNLPEMAYPEDLVLDFHSTDPEQGSSFWVGVISEILFAGKMRGLFTLLFGVSSVLIIEKLAQRVEGLAAADLYFRRLLWLLVLGLVNAYILLWWGDVLFKYALLGMALFSFRKASYRTLTGAALICLVVLTIQPFEAYSEIAGLQQNYLSVQAKQQAAQPLTADDRESIDRWQQVIDDTAPDNESVDEERQVKSGQYSGIFEYNAGRALQEQTEIFYTEDVWDMSLYMFLGIMLFRLGFFNSRVKPSGYLAVAFLGIGTGLAVHTWMNLGLYTNHPDPVDERYYLIFADLGRLPFVIGYLGLIVYLFRMQAFKRVGDWMTAVGRMALSNYMLQSIIGAAIFYGFGLSQFDQLSRLDVFWVVVSIWIFQVIFSVVWMKRFYHGPFEWLWRSLTYWRVQPIRKQ